MTLLCMESGGTKLVAAVADRQARLLSTAKTYRAAEQQAPETLAQLIELGQGLVGKSEAVEAVCLGFGGIVDRSRDRPHACFHEEGWERVDVSQALAKAYGTPVFVENDCKLAALGEAHRGVGLAEGTLFYATLGTGIGGAIVRNGQLLKLGELGEAEIGHTIIDEQGPLCPCGNRGCLEMLCSGPGLENLAERVTGHRADAKSLMSAFRQGEAEAGRVVEQAAIYLGRAFAAVINLLRPDLIVLGGGLMQSNQPFLRLISDKTEACTFPAFRGTARFELSKLDEEAVCQGAALYACQRLLNSSIPGFPP